MKPDWLWDLFDRDKAWLARQPRLSPWIEGRAWLADRILGWLQEYSTSLCDRPVAADGDHARHFAARLWDCWSYHWQTAAEQSPDHVADGQEVAEAIRSGRGYRRGGRLGGDPLRDVVLAVAVMIKNNRATQQFHDDYFDFCRRLAGKVNSRFFADADDWWNDFLDLLAGYTVPPGKLARFQGKCALRNWLGTVVWNFLRRRPLAGAGYAELTGQEPDAVDAPSDDAATHESRHRFARLVADALAQLPDEDHLILCLLYVDQLMLKDAAAILGIHPGNASRQRDRAAARLRELILQAAARPGTEPGFDDIEDDLAQSPEQFADLLYDSLASEWQREAAR